MSPLFSSGNAIASQIVSSGLLELSYSKSKELQQQISLDEVPPVQFRKHKEGKLNIVVFAASEAARKDKCRDFSSKLLDQSSLLKFSSKIIPTFSIHAPAYELFESLFDEHKRESVLNELNSETSEFKNPLIITGYSLGGSLASLFTLWLLGATRIQQRPLCITFGSPLVGDASLQSILGNSVWNSCFLHVADVRDPVPKLLLTHRNATPESVKFKPFGSYLFASESMCAYFDDPDVITKLLEKTGSENFSQDSYEGEGNLQRLLFQNGTSNHDVSGLNSLEAGLFLQLEAVGSIIEDGEAKALVKKMVENRENHERKKCSKIKEKLNKMKINMINLEWYKKLCRKNHSGYYDFYRHKTDERNKKVAEMKADLNEYWLEIVLGSMKKPQSEPAPLRKGWLYAGTTYRRMVEPLEIADHYKQRNKTEFRKSDKAWLFRELEKLMEDDKYGETNQGRGTRNQKNLSDLLTIDSCFWDEVEQALIAFEKLDQEISDEERAETKENLKDFSTYVMDMIKGEKVSSEIFLKGSSFRTWWEKFSRRRDLEDLKSGDLWTYMSEEQYREYGR